ncbi:MAG: Tricorn protease like protein, partial [Saprospiraceae bacterium]|nr:Tricorn protease like protein [Saprospiraceae bacterium]
IHFYDMASGSHAQVTNRKGGFGYNLHWSPDSKHIAFVDEKNDISLLNAETRAIKKVDNLVWNLGHGSRGGFDIAWSHDSKWLTYEKGQENANNAIVVYDVEDGQVSNITSGFFNDTSPIFSKDGKYIFFITDRNFSAAYSDMGDGTWIYPNSAQIAAIALTGDAPSLLKVKYDEYKVPEEKDEEDDKDEEGDKEDKEEGSETVEGEKEGEEAKEEKEEKKDEKLKIDFDNIESRIMILPPSAGNISGLMAFDGKLVYGRFPNTGSGDRSVKLMVYDLKKREDKEVIGDVRGAVMTPDGKSILVRSRNSYGVIKPAPGQKIKDPVPTDGLVMDLIPKEEWKQLFSDAWRRHRDFFYDPNMHGLDWEEIRERYGALIEDARTRWDVTNIMSGMAAELSAGHTYTRNGDVERVQPVMTGFMGIDWGMKSGKYLIKRIVKPAAWDTEVRSPFDQPGMTVKEGDFILSVNGIIVDPSKDPYAAFEGLSGDVVALQVSKTGSVEDAEEVVVKLLTPGQENQLRYLEWIENNRKRVEELSGGKLGYVYMSNTSGRGQLELVKMYYGQLDKEGFIIDERFNGGGQLADRFLELITKPVVYNLHWRHGKDHTQPIKTNRGPMGMLINGWAGSGGDGLPWAFQELEAGPIVGERTLGILVGPATGHRLIDGGGITVPGARLYDNDGHWFWEGEGVSPDIKVWDDPNILVQGRDPQMERVVEEVMKMLKTNTPKMTPAPPAEDRTAKGLSGKK